MAKPWEQDWSANRQDAASDAVKPWERDWSAVAAPAKSRQDGQMVSGFKRSFQEVPGLLAGVGAYAADVVGADDTRDNLLSYAKRKQEEVGAAHANDAQSITDAWDGKVGWLDFLANASGYVAGQALQAIATGGLGALGAKMVAKHGAKELAEAAAAKAIAAGASEKLAQKAAADAIVGPINRAMKAGGVAGAMSHNFGMELGSIYPEAVEQAEKEDRTLDGGDKFKVFAAASLAAGIDTAGEAIMASRVLKGSKVGAVAKDPPKLFGSEIAARAAREVPAGMAREAGMEAAQTGIEQWGAARPLDVREIVDSAGIGAVGGGLGGVAASRTRQEAKHILAAPTVEDAINTATLAIAGPVAKPKWEVVDGALSLPAPPRQEPASLLKSLPAPDGGMVYMADSQGNIAPQPAGARTEALNRDTEARLQDDAKTQAELTRRELLGKQTPRGEEVPERMPVGEATEFQPIPSGEVSEDIPAGEAMELEPIPAGEATELAPETILADDLLARDGQPFGSKTGAQAKAYASGGGAVVAIPDHFGSGKPGYVVRQLLPAQPKNTRGTNASDIAGFAGQRTADQSGSAGVGRLRDSRPNDVLAIHASAAGQVLDGTGAAVGSDGRADALSGASRDVRGAMGAVDAEKARAMFGRDALPAPALSTGDRITLSGKSYSVASVTTAAVKLDDGAGKVRTVARNSKTFSQITKDEAQQAHTLATNIPTPTADIAAEVPAARTGRADIVEADGVATPAKPRVFKNKDAATKARRELGNTHKVQKVKGGFILRQMTDKEVAAAEKAGRRATSHTVDTGTDTLLKAVAKLGGLDRASSSRDLGVAQEDFKHKSGLIGAPTFRHAGGMSADRMLESLKDHHYLPQDAGLHELEDAIGNELRGRPQYSMAVDAESALGEDAFRQPDEDSEPLADLTPDDLDAEGYTSASPEVQALTESLLADAAVQQIDTEAIAETVAMQTDGLTQDQYHAAFQDAIREAVSANQRAAGERDTAAAGRSSEDRGQADGAQSSSQEDDGQSLTLEAQTSEDLKAKADREAEATGRERAKKAAEQERLRRESEARDNKARADQTVNDFQLGQSADQQMSGMGDMFADAPAEPAQQAAAILDAAAEPPKGKERLDVLKDVKAGAITPDEVAAAYPAADPAPITDVGEKIGGARKDMAMSGGVRAKKASTDERPAWARRFEISQIVTPSGMVDEVKDAGRWVIRDTRNLDWMKQPKQVGRDTYATKEEAEAVVPLAAVSLKHRAVPTRDGKYEIWRDITDRKRVKVVDQQFDTREDAMRYMLANAVTIIETNTTFGEADMPLPPDRARSGEARRTGNVVGDDFKAQFGFRGVEFGNWNNQDERQVLMNDAWDGLMDLADVLGVPPKALGLNGDLALAFGARGHGLNSARAHYEPARAVINLTKESGAGSLAHEWFHALDHYFGRQDGKASAKWVQQEDGTRKLAIGEVEGAMVSSGFSGASSGVREELRKAYNALMRTMSKKAETYVEDTAKADKFAGAAKDDLAVELGKLRRDLAEQKDPNYYRRNNKPASTEQLAEFDAIAKRMLDGEVAILATAWRTIAKSGDMQKSAGARASIATRWTNDALERLSALYKEVRGRSGFDSTNRSGVMDRLRGSMDRYSQRLKMLSEAQAGTDKQRAVPTEFAMNAKELDQGRGTDYWTTPHEMAARAFQGYVEDKISERGGVSRFLNYAPENAAILTPWGFKRPYPHGAERVAINKALDEFVSLIQTRENDAGDVAMYSRTLPSNEAITEPQARAAVAATFGDKSARAMLDGGLIEFVTGKDFAGVTFSDGRIQINLSNVSQDNIGGILKHEAFHSAVREWIGADSYDALMARLEALRKMAGRDPGGWAAKASAAIPSDTPASLMNEEFAGYAIEGAGPKPNGVIAKWVSDFMSALRAAIIKRMPGGKIKAWALLNLKAEDLSRMAVAAMRARGDALRVGSGAMAYSRQEQTKTSAFKRWFGDSKVVDSLGAPAIVYHGTMSDVEAFDPSESRPEGVWLTSDAGYANWLLTKKRARPDSASNVMPVFLRMENPLVLDVEAEGRRLWQEMVDAGHDVEKPATLLEAQTIIANSAGGAWDWAVGFYADEARMGAHDGLIIKNFDDGYGAPTTAYIAFKPEQIKSATGNSGAFDPNNADIRYSRTAPDWITSGSAALQGAAGKIDTYAPKKPMADKVRAMSAGWKQKLVQGMLDAYAPLKSLSMDAYIAARMTKAADGAFEGMLMYGKPVMTADGGITGDLDGKGFLGAMRELNGEHDRFFMWLAGNRAERLMAEGKENLFTADEIAAMKALNGGTTADGSPRTVAFKRALDQFNAYSKSVLDVAEKAGLIDGESRALWEHDFYVPFYRMSQENEISGPTKIKGLVRQKAFERLKGGKENLGDLMDNTLRNWSHLLSASLANVAASKSLLAAEQAGIAFEAKEAQAKEMAKAAGLKGNATYFMDQGLQRWFVVEDPAVLAAISSMEAPALNGLPLQLMAKFKKYLTVGVTISPAFKVRNLIRDTFAAPAANEMSFNMAKNLAQGWKATDTKTSGYAQMLFSGGLMKFGTYLEGDRAENVKRLISAGVDDKTILNTPDKVRDMFGKAWDAWQDFGDRMENVNRTALYQQLLDKGMPPREAAFQARDMMDFSLQGSWAAVRTLTAVVPFLNARAQGLYKLGRAGIENPKRMGYVVSAVSLASIMLMLAYGDDDDWKAREDWDRDTWWWFKIGDTAYRIPKPFEIGAMGTIAERSVELAISDEMTGARFAERMKQMITGTFAINPVPQMFKPMLDLYANTDSFTGRQIETLGMERFSKSERYGPNTSALAKAIGSAGDYTGVSPVQVDHMIRAYFGWLGSMGVMTIDAVTSPLSDIERPAKKIDDYFGGFVKELPSASSRYLEDFYKQAKETSELMADLKRAREVGELEKAAKIIKENGGKIAQSRVYQQAQAQLADINKRISLLRSSATMDADTKRMRLDELTALRNQLAKRVIDRARAREEALQ